LTFDEFIQRYKLLAGKEIVLKSSRRETAALLFEKLGIGFERYQLGKNKVFCRVGLISELEAKRKVHIQKMIVGIQSWIRWYSEQKFTEEKYASW
jgi:myosin heavy subunit